MSFLSILNKNKSKNKLLLFDNLNIDVLGIILNYINSEQLKLLLKIDSFSNLLKTSIYWINRIRVEYYKIDANCYNKKFCCYSSVNIEVYESTKNDILKYINFINDPLSSIHHILSENMITQINKYLIKNNRNTFKYYDSYSLKVDKDTNLYSIEIITYDRIINNFITIFIDNLTLYECISILL